MYYAKLEKELSKEYKKEKHARTFAKFLYVLATLALVILIASVFVFLKRYSN